MLPKSKRLNTSLFGNIIKKGQPFHGQFLIIKTVKTSTLSRFAISVSKNVSKHAVTRNKIKRRIYSIIKKLESRIFDGFNVIITVKKGIDKVSYKDLQFDIEKTFVKSCLLK